MSSIFPPAYVEELTQGPFPHGIDPWAEEAHYFHAIHEQMIGHIISQISRPLVERGYIVSREVSLQISELAPDLRQGQPDIQVRDASSPPRVSPSHQTYEDAAATVGLAPGVVIEVATIPIMDNVIVKDMRGELVAMLEIISPRNKVGQALWTYQSRRERYVHQQGIAIVEVDPTRSIQRATPSTLTRITPYHSAIHLPGQAPRVLTSGLFDHPLEPVALPLRDDAIPIDLRAAYRESYRQMSTAIHMRHNQFYDEPPPFPSTLGEAQLERAQSRVHAWEERLGELR